MHKTYYETQWKVGVKSGVYRTRSLTDYHKFIHGQCDTAMNLFVDPNIDWPFGLFSEIIAKTSKSNPKTNKPFNEETNHGSGTV